MNSPEGEATEWARRNKTRLLATPDTPLLFRDMAKNFFDENGDWYKDRLLKGRPMTMASLGIRQGHIVNYIIPLLGDLDIRKVIGADINDAINNAQRFTAREGLDTATAKKPLTRSTRSKLLYSIKLMYDRWMFLGLVRDNPTDGIIKYSKAPERPRSALPRDVLPKLFPSSHGELVRVWRSSMWAALFCVLYDTGTRSGEPRAKKWKDYYPETGFFPILDAIEGGTDDKIKSTKAGNARPGYLQERTVQELAIWRAESRHNGDDDFMFIINGKTTISNAAIGDAFERALKYDATGWTLYWLRHSFVTYSLEVLSPREVQDLAGHSSEIVDRAYQHPDDQTLYMKGFESKKKLDAAREPK
jgi:integrase